MIAHFVVAYFAPDFGGGRQLIRLDASWKRQANKLTKDFAFPSFRDSIVFVNRIASVADHLNHHPDIDVRYSTVTVTVTTHDAGGITSKDLDLAEQIDFATSRAE